MKSGYPSIIIEHGRRVIYFARRKRQYYSRFVMENILQRCLEKEEHVHHIDENKLNDNPENLMVLNIRDHASLHSAGKEFPERRKRKSKKCSRCSEYFDVVLSNFDKVKNCPLHRGNKGRSDKKDKDCPSCGKKIQRRSAFCRSCSQTSSNKGFYETKAS